jgi:hypothetical protein
MAEELLGEAEHAGVRLTVLAVGTWLGQYPQIAQRILASRGLRPVTLTELLSP